MPLYEFQCDGCGRVFEELVRRPSDMADLGCVVCGSQAVRRILSRPAAVSTGGGCDTGGSSGFG